MANGQREFRGEIKVSKPGSCLDEKRPKKEQARGLLLIGKWRLLAPKIPLLHSISTTSMELY